MCGGSRWLQSVLACRQTLRSSSSMWLALDKRVLVVVTGEFGRTPKISYAASTGAGDASAPAGTQQPGRDHWPRAFSNLWAGGGMTTGRVIGATDKRGEDSVERICGPGDFLRTIYHH